MHELAFSRTVHGAVQEVPMLLHVHAGLLRSSRHVQRRTLSLQARGKVGT